MNRAVFSTLVAALAMVLAVLPARGANVTFDVRSARSGNWSDPHTWENGRAPRAGDFVQVRAGDLVTYDVASDDAIRMIHVAGTLTFSREKSTRLCVGLIKIQAGTQASEEGFDCDAHIAADAPDPATGPTPALEIGTTENPIPANVTTVIRLTYFAGTDKESLPAIMDCGGRWDVHGAPLARTWSKLAVTARAGVDSVTLADQPSGWKSGDRIVLTKSATTDFASHHPNLTTTEERNIASVDGRMIRFDEPLEADHIAQGAKVTEAANLSRNVVIESADRQGVRGHTMYHFQSTGGISYAEFRHLGKRNVLGKYPVHFHLVRDSMRGSGVIGASIWDSENRFMAIHGTDYLLVRDCVGYQCVGHGYFLEDATEQYNVLDHNIAIQAMRGKRLPKQALDFDENEGAGFWWANGRNALVGNVACENHLYGYKFQIEKSHGKDPIYRLRQPDGSLAARDIRTVPFLRFEDNESHCDGLYAFSFGDDPAGAVHSDTSHPFIARNLRVWQSHYAIRPNLWSFLMDGLTINHAVYGVYHPDYCDHVYRNIYLNTVTSEPINRGHDDESIQYGSFTYENLTLENCRIGRDPIIQLTCTSPKPGQTGHFKNVIYKNSTSHDSNVVDLGGGPRNDKLENGVVYYFHDMPQPGLATKVVSGKFPQLMNDGDYKQIPGFTGPDVKAAAVTEVPFPTLLTPVDDLPPATMITSVRPSGDKLIIRGISEDDGEVASVQVNAEPAKILSSHAGITEWEISLNAAGVKSIDAKATDKAGNMERTSAVKLVAQ
ncbi:MAG: hypothetical protein JWP03_2525 [Phycisphaerales bacterium]|nr:hypothetical protein [Phycisphaerales bacterium]